ncbi:hypothetical protein THAOC_15952 [Thalassiosira oceanica]|uniref:Uncharacterized protein n=1 Tax=Thalassiosira oceanica TaxID=159749 RepID=K0SYS2_THAOC|nr:hypothetical protein THAOC_15952 [Thalassiosira oceanica]|eukprot:EJK63387.1 hypothetical protein THAOC_15952 [Thalassiosira oceanica]
MRIRRVPRVLYSASCSVEVGKEFVASIASTLETALERALDSPRRRSHKSDNYYLDNDNTSSPAPRHSKIRPPKFVDLIVSVKMERSTNSSVTFNMVNIELSELLYRNQRGILHLEQVATAPHYLDSHISPSLFTTWDNSPPRKTKRNYNSAPSLVAAAAAGACIAHFGWSSQCAIKLQPYKFLKDLQATILSEQFFVSVCPGSLLLSASLGMIVENSAMLTKLSSCTCRWTAGGRAEEIYYRQAEGCAHGR